MKRIYPILFAFLLIFTTLSPAFASLTVNAEENVYTDIENGEYELGVNFWYFGSNKTKKSTAGDYMSDKATLKIDDGKYELTLYNKSPMVIFSSFEIEGVKGTTVKNDSGDDIIFSLTELKSDYESVITYEVPFIHLVHEGVQMDIELVGLENLPKKQADPEPEPTPEPGNGNGNGGTPGNDSGSDNGNSGSQNPGRPPAQPIEVPAKSVLNLDEGNYTIHVQAVHAKEDKASGMAGYLDNTAKLSVRDGSVYVTITINDHTTVTGLQVDGKEPVTVNVDEKNNKREVTYKLSKLYNIHNAQVQYKVGNHNGDQPARLLFDGNSVSKFIKLVEPNKQVEVQPGQVVQVQGKDIEIVMPESLPIGTKVEIDVIDEKDAPNLGKGLKVAGTVIDVDLIFPNGENFEGPFTLTLPYDKDQFSANEVDIYYYNEKTGEWKKQGGTVDAENGTITVVVQHFSTYGVLSAEDNNTKVCLDGEYTIPVEVLKENEDAPSVANQYIQNNEAKLIVKDGKFKVQLTITNNAWWQYFKVITANGYENVRVIIEDSANDTAVVEFNVTNPAEVLPAKVHIIVPAINYDSEYDIRIQFDISGIDLGDCLDGLSGTGGTRVQLLGTTGGTGSSTGQVGTNAGDDDRLTFDRNADGANDKNKEKENEVNPKTADTAKIALFTSLLIVSLIPLIIKLYARFRTVG